MYVTAAVAAKKKCSGAFQCKLLNTSVTTLECIDGYVNANSLNIKHSPCFKCSHGLKVRTEFSNS